MLRPGPVSEAWQVVAFIKSIIALALSGVIAVVGTATVDATLAAQSSIL